MIPRRAIVKVLALGLLVEPVATNAQNAEKVFRLGRLMMEPMSEVNRYPSWLPEQALLDELARRGYVRGRNLILEYRSVNGDPRQLDPMAAELVATKVDVIFTSGGTRAVMAVQKATATIPIVMEMVGDPVGRGLVASLARPGGNVTGNAYFQDEISLKWMHMLVEAVGKPTRIGCLRYRDGRTSLAGQRNEDAMRAHARSTGAQFKVYDVVTFNDLDTAFEHMVRDRVDALVIEHNQFTASAPNLDRIALLAARHRLPAIADGRRYSEAGLLLTYSLDFVVAFRNAAVYIDRILKGANPADLPIQLPLKYELIVNLRTAKALGITIPLAILVQANEVIR